jgi:hypothetical protein
VVEVGSIPPKRGPETSVRAAKWAVSGTDLYIQPLITAEKAIKPNPIGLFETAKYTEKGKLIATLTHNFVQ